MVCTNACVYLLHPPPPLKVPGCWPPEHFSNQNIAINFHVIKRQEGHHESWSVATVGEIGWFGTKPGKCVMAQVHWWREMSAPIDGGKLQWFEWSLDKNDMRPTSQHRLVQGGQMGISWGKSSSWMWTLLHPFSSAACCLLIAGIQLLRNSKTVPWWQCGRGRQTEMHVRHPGRWLLILILICVSVWTCA